MRSAITTRCDAERSVSTAAAAEGVAGVTDGPGMGEEGRGVEVGGPGGEPVRTAEALGGGRTPGLVRRSEAAAEVRMCDCGEAGRWAVGGGDDAWMRQLDGEGCGGVRGVDRDPSRARKMGQRLAQ